MDKDALDKVLELQDQAREIREVNGIKFTTGSLTPIFPYAPQVVAVESLTGLVDFMEKNKDGITSEECVAIIENQNTVKIVGTLELCHNEGNVRPVYVKAIRNKDIEAFPFGRFIDHETFIIKLLTLFKYDDDLQDFIESISKIKVENSLETNDDGVASKVIRKEGIEVNAKREVVKLRPFRTFAEVEQPQTSFIFRASLKSGEMTCALMECDGGAWINQARAAIKTWMEKELPEVPIFA
jgi:hypothetical protein